MTKKINISQSLKWAMLASLLFAFLKGVGFFFSGSLLLLNSMFDSLGDAVMSYGNSRLHQMAKADADHEHPYGHGGIEVLAALIQGFLISFFCLIIVTQAVTRLLGLATMTQLDLSGVPIGFGILVASGAFAFGLHLFLSRQIAKAKASGERSLTLLADHAHYAGVESGQYRAKS